MRAQVVGEELVRVKGLILWRAWEVKGFTLWLREGGGPQRITPVNAIDWQCRVALTQRMGGGKICWNFSVGVA